MTLKFNDLMKKFYEDEMLGIQQEDAPANSVAAGGVDMAPNAVSKKKQKEKRNDMKWVSSADLVINYLQRISPLNHRKIENFGNWLNYVEYSNHHKQPGSVVHINPQIIGPSRSLRPVRRPGPSG